MSIQCSVGGDQHVRKESHLQAENTQLMLNNQKGRITLTEYKVRRQTLTHSSTSLSTRWDTCRSPIYQFMKRLHASLVSFGHKSGWRMNPGLLHEWTEQRNVNDLTSDGHEDVRISGGSWWSVTDCLTNPNPNPNPNPAWLTLTLTLTLTLPD